MLNKYLSQAINAAALILHVAPSVDITLNIMQPDYKKAAAISEQIRQLSIQFCAKRAKHFTVSL